MQKILAVAIKNARIRFSSPAQLIFFIVLPVIFTFALSGGAPADGGGDVRPQVAIVDGARSASGDALIAALNRAGTVRATVMTRDQALAAFERRDAVVVLSIPAPFGPGQWALDVQTQANSPAALAAERAITAAAGDAGRAQRVGEFGAQERERLAPFASAGEREGFVAQLAAEATTRLADTPDRLTKTAAVAEGAVIDDAAQASAGQLVTWVFIPLLGVGFLFVSERARGTLKRTFATPVTRAQWLLGTIGGETAMALVQMLLLIAFGVFALRLPWAREPAALALVAVAFAVCGACLGALLGTLVRSEGQAQGLGILLGMLLALLGGCWYPLEFFPQPVQSAVQVLPTYWAMRGLSDILVRGAGVGAVLLPTGVLLGSAALFLILGVRRFRVE